MAVRVRITYTGNVQGVGFRYRTSKVATLHTVTGYVYNLPDGRVELVAEGEPADVDRFTAAVAERMRGHIDAADRQTLPPTGEFADFSVRH